MASTVAWKPGAGSIPTRPGVYRFLDETGRVLYVGKAKNLRQRLTNYFQPLRSLHERTRAMVLTASDVKWTTVNSDVEALQLEYTWIKEFDPPYNVKYRDDKTYPYLAVLLGDESPRAIVTRTPNIRGARYFGPYPKVWAVRETLELMQRAIPIRTCNDADYKRAMTTGKPCLAGQIGRCGGPCSGRISVEDHRRQVERFVDFLAGRDRAVLSEFERSMADAAQQQQYELAARYRDRIQVLREVLDKSAVVLAGSLDIDVVGIAHDELSAAVQLHIVRGGRIRGVRAWTVDTELDIDLPELVERSLLEIYDQLEPPREIEVAVLPEDAWELEEWLTTQRGDGRRVALHAPQRGEKAAVLAQATRNAGEELVRYKLKRSTDFTARTQALSDLQTALGLVQAPLRIECYDVSHLSGTNIVASMVVFEDGAPRKDQYRRFMIAEAADDTDSLYQVLVRRLSHLREVSADPKRAPVQGADPGEEGTVAVRPAKFSYPPNLLLIDGGPPQVAAAQRALDESGAANTAPAGVRVVGIAKRLEELWLPNQDFPVILPRGSEALFLVQRLRDEAHRFAITHQRARRGRDIASTLSEVPGLGPSRVRGLLRHFGSVARLRAAEPAAIEAAPGIGPVLAAAIHARLHG
ncbi:MAG: excinuclease ABC subunit UvrC [Microbacterium sp.]|nr:excinuclease ABC subunit UvrC [Microbacterium sp.]